MTWEERYLVDAYAMVRTASTLLKTASDALRGSKFVAEEAFVKAAVDVVDEACRSIGGIVHERTVSPRDDGAVAT